MRIAIYGAGSLGVILGAYLAKDGLDVELVHHTPAAVAALNEKGARVRGTVEMDVPVRACLPEEMAGDYDIIFLMTKQTANAECLPVIREHLGEDGVVCTLQNGIPEPSVAAVIGQERVLGCTVAWGATLLEPGCSQLTSQPDSLSFGMGALPGVPQEKLEAVKTVLEHMCPVELEEDLLGVRWSKLLINATFSALGTVIGGTFGDVATKKPAKTIAQYLMRECIDVGHASGATFAPVQGKDAAKLFYFKSAPKRWFGSLILPIAMKKHRRLVPSMLQDLRKGKRCEIDAISGVVCEYGKKHGVPTPWNDKAVEVVHRIEAGQLQPAWENLKEFGALLRAGR